MFPADEDIFYPLIIFYEDIQVIDCPYTKSTGRTCA